MKHRKASMTRAQAITSLLSGLSQQDEATAAKGLDITFTPTDETEAIVWDYNPTPTQQRVHASKAILKVIEGAVRSGKTVAAIMDMLLFHPLRCPVHKGTVSCRYLVARLSLDQLIHNTLPSILRMLPENLPFHWHGNNKTLSFSYSTVYNNTPLQVEIEMLFRSFEHARDEDMLRGMEVTGLYCDEYSDFRLPFILDQGFSRTGMHKRGEQPYAVFTSNPPVPDHWMARMEQTSPAHAQFFHLPSALSEEAENLDNLPTDYYNTVLATVTDKNWVRRNIYGERVPEIRGRLIHPQFGDIHIAKHHLVHVPTHPLYIGIDFGLSSAAVFGQRNPVDNTWAILAVDLLEDLSVKELADRILLRMRQDFAGQREQVVITGDPAGTQRNAATEKPGRVIQTGYSILNSTLSKAGLRAVRARTNNPDVRFGALNGLLATIVDGRPAIQFANNLLGLHTSLRSYHYASVQTGGTETFSSQPVKDKHSHMCDAVHYMLLGAGEDGRFLSTDGKLPNRKNGANAYIPAKSFTDRARLH